MRHGPISTATALSFFGALFSMTLAAVPATVHAAEETGQAGSSSAVGGLDGTRCLAADEDGPPSGQTIWLFGDEPGLTRTTMTDERGRFAFVDVPSGVYWLVTQGRAGRRVDLRGDKETANLCDEASATLLEALPADAGGSVDVVLADGARHKGRLASASSSALVLRVGRTDLVLPVEAVWRVEARRRRVSIWNATGTGAAFGALLPYLWFFLSWDDPVAEPPPYVHIGWRTSIGAAAGFVVGLCVPKEHVLLYQAGVASERRHLQVSPLLTPHAQGAVVSLAWGGR